jgi:hypothetical protein
MRIWDQIAPSRLCRKHLLAEHRELHAIWNIVVLGKRGYRNHPEVRRWAGHLRALKRRHSLLVWEMAKRGYKHNTPLPKVLGGKEAYPSPWDNQEVSLANKNCKCERSNEI